MKYFNTCFGVNKNKRVQHMDLAAIGHYACWKNSCHSLLQVQPQVKDGKVSIRPRRQNEIDGWWEKHEIKTVLPL